MRDDVKELVRWANDASESSQKVAGSLRAEVEVSADRLARHIAVREGGEMLHDAVVVFGSKQRPDFYPEDLPFISGEMVAISPKGALWTCAPASMEAQVDRTREAAADLMSDPRMSGFVSTVEGIAESTAGSPRVAADELRKSIPKMTAEEREILQGAFAEAFAPSGVAGPLFEQILAHHRDEGWSLEEEKSEGMAVRRVLATRGGERRRISAMEMMGAGSVTITRNPD